VDVLHGRVERFDVPIRLASALFGALVRLSPVTFSAKRWLAATVMAVALAWFPKASTAPAKRR
jgi:hypothetical protein